MYSTLANKINELTNEPDNRKSLDLAIETANELITLLNPRVTGLKTGEDALDENIPINKFPNYKAESWFAQHPYFTGERVALNFYESDTVQIKFYWLGDTATKARVSAGVMLTPNWEDSDLTRNDQYKVGIDFFLSANTKSLLMVVSNNGNLRILEFNDHLSNTQQEILQNLRGVLELGSKEQIHKTLWDSLALSEVNKKFYLGIAEKFNELLNHLVADGKDAEDSKLFASRLLGRLLFIWFLRRKNIIQEQYGYFEVEGPDSTEYYDQKLKKLFFKTLNTPASDRKHSDDKTPYLNGGLFEAHDNDWAHQKVSFPTGYFNRLYEHLMQYNFTTDESSPEYEQVAIDPEMLGRVFESLLATQVTETGDQARKAKGAFYTPREIVSYMCKESLRQYLYTKLNNENQNEGIDKLLDISHSEWELQHTNAKRNLWGEKDRNTVPAQVLQALDDLKILDPACGSGAFPMGMLQLMLKTYERLDNRFDAYKTKLRIVQENIYGVDIEPMAVEIARLRAWLSLIVDEDDDNKIKPLPNLDFKFIAANSLVSLSKDFQLGDEKYDKVRSKMQFIIGKYFSETDKEEKRKLKEEFNRQSSLLLQTNIFGEESELQKQLSTFKPFDVHAEATFFDPKLMYGLKSSSPFDVIIGNPPYVNVEKIDSKFKPVYSKFKTAHQKYDLYVLFYERGISLLTKNGVMSYITSNKWMSQGYGKKLRELLLGTTICSIVNFNYDIFDSATVRTAIVTLRKVSPGYDATIKVMDISSFDEREAFTGRNFSNLKQDIFYETEENNFRLNLNNVKIGLLKKIQSNSKPLFDICSVNYGLRPSSESLGLKKEAFIHNSNPGKYKSYFEGKDMGYWVVKNKYYLDYRPDVMYNPMFPELFENKKLIGLRTLSDIGKLRFIFDTEDLYCNDSVVIVMQWFRLEKVTNNTIRRFISAEKVKTSRNYSYELLQGILNSKLIRFYFNELMYDGTHFYPNHMKSLPIALINETLHDVTSRIEELVIEARNLNASNTNRSNDGVSKNIDELVYQLYELTPEEIDIIAGSISR